MSEIWKNLPTFEDSYEISNKGRLRSKPRKVVRISKLGNKCYMNVKETHMKGTIDSVGYLIVNLRKDSKTVSYRLHQLVVWAFENKAPGTYEAVRHLDGNKLNNDKENLIASTDKGNHKDREAHGSFHIGSSKTTMTKITPEDVRFIRLSNIKISQLAKLLDISVSHVNAIKKEKFWNPYAYLRVLKNQLAYNHQLKDISLLKISVKLYKEFKVITPPNHAALKIGKNLVLQYKW